jgi:transcriptional regulator with XRE-family HTH domain
MITRQIAQRVTNRRKELGLSRFKLASLAQLHPRLIERIEATTGTANPTILTLLALAGGLGISIADLIGPELETPPKHQPIILSRSERRLLESVNGLEAREIRFLIEMTSYMRGTKKVIAVAKTSPKSKRRKHEP